MIHSGRTAFPGAPRAGLPEGGAPVTAGGRIAGAIGVSGVESGPDARLARAAYKASRPDPRAFSIPGRNHDDRPSRTASRASAEPVH
nr:heme-binding protein [Burkholderia vietnamiensis]